ncbi:MAG: hypothetical protein LUD48_06130 [Prevotella sp.]|nr:hypothetical protein [Prevotella sp.]
MALQGRVKIQGREYGVVECEYEFSQSVDDTGKPTTRTQGGTIKFVMPTTSDDDQFFYKWMFDKTAVYSGTFRFCVFSNDNRRKYKTVEFTNAYCIGLKDNFCDNDSKLMYTTIKLSAEVIRVGTGVMDSAIFTNDWATLMSQIENLSTL